jgi:choline dehydrogenase-like flavoprotein
MAGLFIARKLALAGHRVVVLESGKAGFDEETHELNQIVDIGGRYTRALNGRYRGLGGSSSRWGGRMLPIYEHDTESRDYVGLDSWPFPYHELERHAGEVEDVFGLPHGSYGAGALRDAGLDEAFPSDDPDFTGRLAKWINFRQCNLSHVWGRELESIPNLEIWLGATVTNFVLDREQGALRAIEARNLDGDRLRVEAERFVVAAGTIESTRLLLWLDACSNNRAFAGTTALGRYFQDHLKAEVATISRQDQELTNRLFGYHFVNGTRRSLHLDLTTTGQEEDAATSAFVYAAMDLSRSGLSRIKAVVRGLQSRRLQLRDLAPLLNDVPLVLRSAYWRYLRRQLYMPADVRLGVQIAIEQRPRRDNFIALGHEKDRLGIPRAELHWEPSEADEATFRSTAARLRGYWQRTGLDGRCPLEWMVGEPGDPTRFVDRAEAHAHPSGSTRMGTDPATSVVGPDLVCHGVPNLSVASASVFPSSGSANPTYTILQLALRHAQSLLAGKVTPVVRESESGRQAGSAERTAAMAALIASPTRATSSSSI